MNLLHADAGGLRARLEQPGIGNAGHEFAKTIVIEDVDEFGYEDAGFAGASADGQLVSKVADGGESHAGNAEVLAEGGDIFHVKFIEGDDAIDAARPGHIADGVNQTLQRELFGHGGDFVDTFERPGGVAKFFDGEEKDAAAERFAGADEFLALFVGTDAENGERLFLRHGTPPLERERIERGLYSGFACGIQKLQKRADALRPSYFVVLGAFHALVMQIALELPAFFKEHVAEFLDFLHDARAFARADIEPDARARLHGRCFRKTVDHVLVPPDGRRERGDSSKNARMLETEIEGNEAAQRGATDAGMLRARKSAVFAFDEGLHFFDEKFCVAVGAAAAEFGNVSGSVFANTRFGVVHANDDQRSDRVGLNASISSLTDVPVLPGDEGSGAIKKILAVLEIEDRETARGLIVVAGRSVNNEVALIAEKARTEIFVFPELSRTHGAMVTRRSLASTCWPEVTRIFTIRPEMGA